ncbi:MAG: ADP-ribosylglycohydrolase family protein [Loktanella sp.]|nr:ADP-ribosylglycohydrolase family protein [Loktanella sp.]
MMTGPTLSRDRAEAALWGLALGDALGMPSQTLDRATIAAHYGRITTFVAPFDGHPISHGLGAGQITDDTEQTLILANRLIAHPGTFDSIGWANDLLTWEADIRDRGLRDLLGPSSKAALDALLTGASLDETGKNGTTNGAAMRISPIGIMTPPDPEKIVADVMRTCRVTHNTGEAIAAASAVAMVVSAGIAGSDFEEALPLALEAARLGQTFGHPTRQTNMAERIALALDLADRGLDALIDGIGTSVQSRESVAAAFGVLRLTQGDTWQALQIAANIGDDTDTIGAIAGAMGGACSGMAALPAQAVATVRAVNKLDMAPVAAALLALRVAQPLDTAS